MRYDELNLSTVVIASVSAAIHKILSHICHTRTRAALFFVRKTTAYLDPSISLIRDARSSGQVNLWIFFENPRYSSPRMTTEKKQKRMDCHVGLRPPRNDVRAVALFQKMSHEEYTSCA